MNGQKKKRSKTAKKSGRKSAPALSNEKFFLQYLEREVNKQPKRQTKPKRERSVIEKNLSKRRGKEIYDIFFKRGAKSQIEIENAFDKVKKFRELPNERIKITFVAGYKNKRASITQLYDLDEPREMPDVLKEINTMIFNKPVRGTTKSIKRMNRLKNYINRIIIDFESAE